MKVFFTIRLKAERYGNGKTVLFFVGVDVPDDPIIETIYAGRRCVCN